MNFLNPCPAEMVTSSDQSRRAGRNTAEIVLGAEVMEEECVSLPIVSDKLHGENKIPFGRNARPPLPYSIQQDYYFSVRESGELDVSALGDMW